MYQKGVLCARHAKTVQGEGDLASRSAPTAEVSKPKCHAEEPVVSPERASHSAPTVSK